MKKFYILVAMLLVSVSALAQNGRAIYNKFSDYPNVEAVYISPAMFRLIGKIPDVQMEGESVNFSTVIKSLTGFYVLTISDDARAADLAADVNRFINKGDYELLMEAKEQGNITRMYTVGTEDIVNGLVMFTNEPGETTFVCIDGTIPRDQLENLLADMAKE